MKILFILGNTTWFWVWNDNFAMWDAWIEREGEVAERRPANDFGRFEDVQEHVKWLFINRNI